MAYGNVEANVHKDVNKAIELLEEIQEKLPEAAQFLGTLQKNTLSKSIIM